jgi:hypothetical protein
MIAQLAIAVLTATLPTQPDLPTDPAQRAATKAMRGDHGTLKPWQREGYTLILSTGATANRTLVLTAYYGTEPDGIRDRYGNPCTYRTCASNRLPRHAYVWTERSNLRQVLDCGARSNDSRARRVGGEGAVWVDVWYRSARHARAAGIDGWGPVRGAVVSR